ncbi:threonine--tRNA ligase [Solidesulfovibrio magneticus]|uniref:Threonine--tRNA ligase n=1 Tax=Solidesulfovibrio magneticus (strain ATCC 700980 / DSM 13731 / RS-1) TaxID=573370 RepID=SYT_SOLM1|nr:threonine--tRNA ligase [Solidesulfovibrio magneticus]C4XL11.1 RecName: Full=Threonine--tRNA ligase; AltName: Full=Threonyl-tRNA synthetase; Short=ThrRS [Solidesulfovibrio magneticus RS-1]BAH74550.1 threonyl-tRNA synthetase [Solidesulfovibrio magneticus RS-1]
MQVTIEDQSLEAAAGEACGQVLSRAVSGKRLKNAVACLVDGQPRDLAFPLPEDAHELALVAADSPMGLSIIRHSAAHIMAEAVKTLFPSVQVTIGPAIENGFYYDFAYERPFTPDDLEAIEAEMQKSIAANQPFSCTYVPKADAKALFAAQGESYKLEIMDENIVGDTVSLYRHGTFTDLCRGPHVPTTGLVRAVKLLSVAGAYWRGDEKRPMLQRIYGTAFASAADLKTYLHHIEEAKKRDHRKLGAQLDLFSFSEEVGAGMCIWHPKGELIRTIIEDFERREHLRRGYDLVRGPLILRRELWERSGHYDNYRENMYFTEIDEQSYGIKPMNCLSHMLIYKSRVRSYRDLPQRYFELGVVHRHEKSGVLHGLLRVRQFTQDDAHILCRPDQLQEEITGVVRFVQDVVGLFGFDFEAELSTRPEKSIGSDEDWDRATKALVDAMESIGLPYEVNEGDGAFYGPKIDIKLKDALDRRWQCATIQCDFTLPERFDLVYTDADGERKRPVMLHRVILGAVERFLGVLIEHTAGALPTWLSPVQARILIVTDAQKEFAEQALARLKEAGIRVELDDRNEKLGFKVREAQVEKIPYMLVAGDKEKELGGLNVRLRSGENLGVKTLDEVALMITADCQEPFKRGGMRYNFCSQ